MRLVYSMNQQEVKVGDTVKIDADLYKVDYFRPPHSTASSGKVTVRLMGGTSTREYYVSIIGAEWIEREDREEEDRLNGLVDFGARGPTDYGDSVDGPDIHMPVIKLSPKATIGSLIVEARKLARPSKGAGAPHREYLLYAADEFVGQVYAKNRKQAIKEGKELYFRQDQDVTWKALPFVGTYQADLIRKQAEIPKVNVLITEGIMFLRFPKKADRGDKCVVSLSIPLQTPDKWDLNVERSTKDYMFVTVEDYDDRTDWVEKEFADRDYLRYANVREAITFLGLLTRWLEEA